MADRVLRNPRLLIMTDYDGTLVPIRERPELALPGSDLLGAMRGLAGKKGVGLAVVSGRDADSLIKIVPVPGIYLAGCHGAEICCPGGVRLSAVDDKTIAPLLDLVAGRAMNCISGRNGFLVERKKAAVALHYRLAGRAEARKVLADFLAAVRLLAAEHNLQLVHGKKVIEVRPGVVNKGEAVRRLISLHPGHYPLYFGDDITDEDAFRAVQDRGLGILVGRRRVTAASGRLGRPRDVIRFLQIVSAQFRECVS